MNIAVVYFSQTGQTLKVAEAMATGLREKKHTVKVLAMQKIKPADIKNCDLLGVGSPCFESQAPAAVLTWLRAWPALHGKPAFVFATAGGAPGRVLYDLTKTLRKKGAKVIGGFMGRGMVHHPAPCLIGRLPNRPNRRGSGRSPRLCLGCGQTSTIRQRGHHAGEPPGCAQTHVGFLSTGRPHCEAVSCCALSCPSQSLIRASCNQCKICAKECPVTEHYSHTLPGAGRPLHPLLPLPECLSAEGPQRILVVRESRYLVPLQHDLCTSLR